MYYLPMNATYNTNESVKVVINAALGSREMTDLISSTARAMVDTGCGMPEDFEDIFTISVVTRPSGSKYAVVNFA